MSSPTPATSTKQAYRVLALTSIAVFLVSLDLSIVVVAKRTIDEDLGGGSLLTWVFSAYAIAYAAALLTAGRFADVFGRKRSFLRGVLWFSFGSLLCGLAPTTWFLVIARIVQAFGGAQLSPASLALVLPEFPVEKRTQAIAIWGATGGLAAALGPSIGGILVDTLGWRWLFFVNIPFTLLTVFFGRRILRESKDPNAQRKVDYPSAALGFSGVALVVLGISQSEVWGWLDSGTIGALGAGILLCFAFALRCHRAEFPILDLKLFRLRFVLAANVAGVLFSMGFIGMWLLNTFWLQAVWGYSVAISGLATMPGPTSAAFIAPFAGRYANRLGHSRVLFAGAMLLAVGTFGLNATIPDNPAYLTRYLPWMLVTGIGVGLSISTLSSSATAFLKPTQFAMGSALNNTFRQVGTALGAALSLAIAAPALARVETARRSGASVLDVSKTEIHGAWLMNAFIYVAAGTAMVAIFKRPTESQMTDARG
ncbi:MAG: MFS transporter [Ilumatobacteraceae bacterium]|jgi:EmrB/QacA subfamily drug resistance transporter